jgi:hypothetical protein
MYVRYCASFSLSLTTLSFILNLFKRPSDSSLPSASISNRSSYSVSYGPHNCEECRRNEELKLKKKKARLEGLNEGEEMPLLVEKVGHEKDL